MVFDYCKTEPVVLLLDECDFIAKSRTMTQDVGEVPRIVNMLLTLLDEYNVIKEFQQAYKYAATHHYDI